MAANALDKLNIAGNILKPNLNLRKIETTGDRFLYELTEAELKGESRPNKLI